MLYLYMFNILQYMSFVKVKYYNYKKLLDTGMNARVRIMYI